MKALTYIAAVMAAAFLLASCMNPQGATDREKDGSPEGGTENEQNEQNEQDGTNEPEGGSNDPGDGEGAETEEESNEPGDGEGPENEEEPNEPGDGAEADGDTGGSGDGDASAESVASPSFTPEPGNFTADTTVSIEPADPGHDVYYTTDGSEPTTGSTLYGAPVPVTGDGTELTLSAVAVSSDGSASKIVTGTFSVRYLFELTAGADPGGLVSTTPEDGIVASGESATVLAEPEEGYLFAGWDPPELGSDNPLELAVTEDTEVRATFDVLSTEGALRGGITVHEVLPDPTGSPGVDTDGNGSPTSSDEFVEIANGAEETVSIAGLELWDPGAKLWFSFPDGAELEPGGVAVVLVRVAEDGALPEGIAFDAAHSSVLNNGGDVVILYDPDADQYTALGYGGEAELDPTITVEGFSASATRAGSFEEWSGTYNGRSLTRPEVGAAAGAVVPHTELAADGASPGTVTATP